ncbi:hypothetical protein [Macrococcus armenti]|uniref:hypothetical protein n=1 Tax=Macrococcus armenti TaxID=2875764 RepID=UPI001CD42A73|nr:hypothetical protein [Macrococcus armenti]UBH10080.1 hypothetical protein LAU38_07275 [Macrococcus armenti]
MALWKAKDVINLSKEKVRLTKDSGPIEMTVKRANEINKQYREKYKKDYDILERVEEDIEE